MTERAEAAEAKPSKDTAATAQARALYEHGLNEYRRRDYRRAIMFYEQSLKLSQRPSLLFNIAQCYRMLEDPSRALDFYRQYLAVWRAQNPSQPAPNYDEVRNYIESHSKNVTPPASQPTEPPKVVLDVPKSTVVETPEPAFTSEPRKEEAGETARSSTKPLTKPFYKTWWFWTSVGVLAGGVTAALIVVMKPSSLEPVTGVDFDGTPTATIQF